MAFPVSPTDGQTATVNNIVYTFSTANNTWTRTATGFVNLGASGNISAIGNIYGNFIIGNITGNVTAVNAQTVTTNAQPNITSVGTLTSVTSSGLISTTGNIAGSYLFGNGSQLTNVVANTINTTFSGSANPANQLYWWNLYSLLCKSSHRTSSVNQEQCKHTRLFRLQQ